MPVVIGASEPSEKTVLTGEEAIELYNQYAQDIDLVLMDLGMAGMGGKKCLEKLIQINPLIKVIVASGYGSYEIINEPGKYGAKAFLSKPYQLEMLVTTVREVLDLRLKYNRS